MTASTISAPDDWTPDIDGDHPEYSGDRVAGFDHETGEHRVEIIVQGGDTTVVQWLAKEQSMRRERSHDMHVEDIHTVETPEAAEPVAQALMQTISRMEDRAAQKVAYAVDGPSDY